jgi:hypothetical protein
MKIYLIVSGTLFGLLALVHVWRIIAEGSHLAKDPWFVLITLVATALSFWSWRVLRRLPRS